MRDSLLGHIDAVASSGKAIISGNNDAVVALVKQAIESDQSVSFYLSRAQAAEVREWYWTPERTRVTGIKPISEEETRKIHSELGLEVTNFRYAPLDCECGHTYGAFDFLAQGIQQHGLDAVRSIFSLENSTFFQVNPRFVPICPDCARELPMMQAAGGGWYDCDEYGGCCCCASVFDRVSLSYDSDYPPRPV